MHNSRGCSKNLISLRFPTIHQLTEREAVGVPGWQTGAKALHLYSQFSQVCKPVRRAPTWLKTALMEWNALHTILAQGRSRLCVSHNAPVKYKRPPVKW